MAKREDAEKRVSPEKGEKETMGSLVATGRRSQGESAESVSARAAVRRVEHTLDPVYDGRSEVLVLGTMPSPKSREIGFYYGHPQNRFWRVLAALFDEPVPETNEERVDLLLRHHIALWDVLASCDIEGASDASIANAVPNDLSRVIGNAPIKQVFCTGATAGRLYGKLCEEATGMPAVKLPSTSPANAAWSLERLVEAYGPVAEAVTPSEPPTLNVSDVVALEQEIARRGTSLDALMRRAGRFLAYEARKFLEARSQEVCRASVPRIVILCGNGNNGGDGWVAGEYLDTWGIPVCLVTAKAPEELSAEPARTAALRACAALGKRSQVVVAPTAEELRALLGLEGEGVGDGSDSSNAAVPSTGTAPAAAKGQRSAPQPAMPLVIDALLGTGFAHDTVRDPFDEWVRAANEAHRRGAIVVAADVPSGLSAQTGIPAADTVQADVTVTMIVSKPGLEQPEASSFCGRIIVAPIADVEPLV